MVNYANIIQIVWSMSPADSASIFSTRVVPDLVRLWLADYDPTGQCQDIVETTSANFSYLFDVANGRLIAAWGISLGRDDQVRDKARMAGHPQSAGTLYHRGHAIPHTLGGPTDINLVPQLGSINVGPFRELERNAVATPGALYFTSWKYAPGEGQKPIGVDQGLLIPGSMSKISAHQN